MKNIILKIITTFLLSTFLLSFYQQLDAAENPVTTVLKLEKVTKDVKGKEVLTEVKQAKPGELLQYTLTVTNGSDREITNVTPVLPIPSGMKYVADSAKPSNAQASTDSKNYSEMPLKVKIKNAKGKTETVVVPYVEYRSLRWTISKMKAKTSITVSARVIMLDKKSAK